MIFDQELNLFYRPLAEGIGEAVARRTFLRKLENGEYENWAHVADRTSKGNCGLHKSGEKDLSRLRELIAKGAIMLSGRQLQHGDENQSENGQEKYVNCATSLTTHMLFYLALNGCGIGTSYDDELVVVDWNFAPKVICLMSEQHPDFKSSKAQSRERFEESQGKIDHVMGDSREGWAKAVEELEVIAFKNQNGAMIDTFVIDCSDVRPENTPIEGMQGRPASGPNPLIEAFYKVNAVIEKTKQTPMKPWKIKMHVDHYFGACVMFGGVRRIARAAYKFWKDPGIFDFIDIKQDGELWSANNSVAVDEEFWQGCMSGNAKCLMILARATEAAYYHNSGEPGLLNIDKLVQNNEGLEKYLTGELQIGSSKYIVSEAAQEINRKIFKNILLAKYKHGVNPCFEISLQHNSGFCVLADIFGYNADTLDEVIESAKHSVRSTIRLNLMDSVYGDEVRRTNRIGVSFVGWHEFAWKFFRLSFRDLIDEKKSQHFWDFINDLNQIVIEEADRYADELGVVRPHTITCIKPAGSTSKVWSITEGIHLPAMKEYLRWVQFKSTDPLVDDYELRGYPVRRDLKNYEGSVIVGFPTQPEICKLDMGDKLVTISEATIQEQFQWLFLIEKYWIVGVNKDGTPREDRGNQISATIKFKPEDLSYNEFYKAVLEWQPKIKCASIMPQVDATAYEYQPEEPISREKYDELVAHINGKKDEDVDFEHVDCAGGFCPIDFSK